MSTPIDSPWRNSSRSSSGTDGSVCAGPGMFKSLPRCHRAADLDLGVDLALLDAHRAHAQAHRAVGQIEDLPGVNAAATRAR